MQREMAGKRFWALAPSIAAVLMTFPDVGVS
jgi:hypothetical protein